MNDNKTKRVPRSSFMIFVSPMYFQVRTRRVEHERFQDSNFGPVIPLNRRALRRKQQWRSWYFRTRAKVVCPLKYDPSSKEEEPIHNQQRQTFSLKFRKYLKHQHPVCRICYESMGAPNRDVWLRVAVEKVCKDSIECRRQLDIDDMPSPQ